tara:strand:+ start:526 stop:690 length:165 start_codon:yes stop_codon:yes gene_type:complete
MVITDIIFTILFEKAFFPFLAEGIYIAPLLLQPPGVIPEMPILMMVFMKVISSQ